MFFSSRGLILGHSMGDGGVACVPSQHIMEKFSICGGNTNGNTKLNSASKTPVKLAKVNKKMKPKKFKGNELASINSVSLNNKEVAEKNGSEDVSNDNNKDEVEEGELGTLPFENGEFVLEKPVRRYEIKSEVEKGEFIPGKWRKGGGEWEKNDWSSSKEELEKGEFIPDNRWCRNDAANKASDFSYSKARRYDSSKDKSWKNEREWTSPSARDRGWRVDRDSEWSSPPPPPPPPREKGWKGDRDWSPPGKDKGWKGDRDWSSPSSGKYSSEKELGRSGGSVQNLRKFSSRFEAEKIPKISSKITGEEGTLKNDFTNSKSHARDYSFGNRLKRHVNDFDGSERKYRADYDEYSGPKNRKLSDDGGRSGFPSGHYSGRNIERPYKTTTSSSRNIPSERHGSRFMDSSRAAQDRHNCSPHHSERSPHDRARNHDRDRSPAYMGHQHDRSRSPYDRSRHFDNRGRSPVYVDPSPRNHGRNRDGKDRKAGAVEKRPSHYAGKGQEGKPNQVKDSGGKESQFLAKKSPDRGNVDSRNASAEKVSGSSHEELSQSPSRKSVELSQENGIGEEAASMEEDMDICNTPPHVPHPQVANVVSGKWYYLDLYGVDCGPSKLSDLKTLLEEGYLVSDHLIKHSDSDRWVTVEKASSPLVTANFHSVVPDTVTQLVCPPEAPGNLLTDNGNEISSEELPVSSSHQVICSDDKLIVSKPVEDFHIDGRVGALLEGITLIPGKEVEMLTGMYIFFVTLLQKTDSSPHYF